MTTAPVHPHYPDARVGDSWSADQQHHLVEVRRHTFNPETSDMDGEMYVLDPLEAIRFGQSLITAGSHALGRQVRDAVAGDCARCGNDRLTDEVRSGGRTSRVYCPDCRDVFDNGSPPTYAALVDLERHVLRGGKVASR